MTLQNKNTQISNLLNTETSKATEALKKLDQTKSTYNSLINDLNQEIEAGKVKVSQIKDKLTVNLIDKILFDSGSAEVNAQGQLVLRKVAKILIKIKDKRIQIDGHTDDVKITSQVRKKFPSNWELSVLRAVSVVRFLTEQCGLDPKNVSAAGYSQFQPVSFNDSIEGRRNNRRIEIILTPLEKKLDEIK